MVDTPDKGGHFGEFGGKFVPETLMYALTELEKAYLELKDNPDFKKELNNYLRNYVGRPTPLFFAEKLSRHLGGDDPRRPRIFLKREDLCHTGAHKINNAIGQMLLAKKMGKTRIIAETGAGQHGVATATAAASIGLSCEIYMGTDDMKRQSLNVYRMKLLGAKVIPVAKGSRTLKDAISEAMRDWTKNVKTTHYLLGSVLGPHPFPMIVRDFQSVIGRETVRQASEEHGITPTHLIACVGGGSNAMGLFYPFLKSDVRMIGVEAGGRSLAPGEHAARFAGGSVGVFQGTKTYLLHDKDGQINITHSISAGLDYSAVGPEHSFYKELGRIEFDHVNDDEALSAFDTLSRTEGIIPALESAHAIAYVIKNAGNFSKDDCIIVNLSGRGDKDVNQVATIRGINLNI